MSPRAVFVVQFFWFLLAWAVIAVRFIAPRLRNVEADVALSFWVAPHLFRILGLGLLVPNLSPGMPAAFATPTAIGDAATAALALASLLALQQRWRRARALVWLFNLFGSADLLVAFVQSTRLGVTAYLGAQWYVPALGVPLMVVAHVMVFHTLLTRTHAGEDAKDVPGPQ